MDSVIRDQTTYIVVVKNKNRFVSSLTKEELEQEVCYLIDCLERYDNFTERMQEVGHFWRNGLDIGEEDD